jgi:mannose-6-phosphate isomerase-like protein (cupin superfamily)
MSGRQTWRALVLPKETPQPARLACSALNNRCQEEIMMTLPANLAEKLATFTDRFSPRTVATYNGNDVMVAKLEGPFHWHKHDDTDDFFLVLSGTLDIELRDRTVTLNPGEVFVVPKGVEHRPVARGEVHILLIEPTGTPNTGDTATAAPRILA